MNPEGMVVLSLYEDGGPVFYFFRDGLEEEKCVSICVCVCNCDVHVCICFSFFIVVKRLIFIKLYSPYNYLLLKLLFLCFSD